MVQKNQEGLSSDQTWIQHIEKLSEGIAVAEGCVLYDFEFAPGRVLRLFIDKDSGAGIDDCSNVSKALNEVLDADENLVPGGNYQLEVSTPGIDRALKKLWHFEKVIGQKIWIKTKAAFNTYGVTFPKIINAKQVEARLVACAEGQITLETSDGQFQIPFVEIEKAKVVFELKKNDKKQRG